MLKKLKILKNLEMKEKFGNFDLDCFYFFEVFSNNQINRFGNQSVKRIVNWIKKSNIPKDSRIIDLGCGNGYTCCQLAEEGFLNLTGIDYSENAIKLAEKLSKPSIHR